jgi:nucleotide-binding universal stress UspA family protein
MFHKILAAIDTSSMSQPVFDCALSLAKSSNAHLGLLYAFSPDEFEALPHPKLEALEEYPRILEDSLSYYIGHLNPEHLNATDNPEFNLLQSYTRQAIAQGVSAEFFLNVGAPGVAICDFAKAWQADLIVIGHRRRSGLTEFLLGSVSNHVVHHASCSVHIVRQSKQINSKDSEAMQVELSR